jgi:hypothetical protein
VREDMVMTITRRRAMPALALAGTAAAVGRLGTGKAEAQAADLTFWT